jgi:hypothetical protein
MATPENSSHIYEVGMPHPTREQQLALQGMAGAFGWTLQEISDPSEQTITEQTFQEVSTRTWGDPTYGTVAHMLIKDDRHRGQQPSVRLYGDYYTLNGTLLWDDNRVGRRSDNAATVENNLRRKWDSGVTPYELLIEKPANSAPQHWTLEYGNVTQDRLARFAVQKNWNAHNLHGTLGKALEVISLSADLIQPDEINTEISYYDDTPFISLADFNKELTAAPMTSHRRGAIRELIRDRLREQLSNEHHLSGKAELVFEGPFTRERYAIQPERLAVYSLQSLRGLLRFDDQQIFINRIREKYEYADS